MVPVRLHEVLRERGIGVVEVPERSSILRDRTCWRSVRVSRWRWKGTPRPAAGWRRQASRFARTPAPRYPARATAVRPASLGRSTALDRSARAPARGRYAPARCIATGSCCTSSVSRPSCSPTGCRCSRCTGCAALDLDRERIVDTISFSGATREPMFASLIVLVGGRVRRGLPGEMARRLVDLDRGGHLGRHDRADVAGCEAVLQAHLCRVRDAALGRAPYERRRARRAGALVETRI